MNIPPFAVPGLFPTTSPNVEERKYTFPDGSMALPVYTGDPAITFFAALSTPSGKLLLRDETGSHIFTEPVDEGTVTYNFVLDGENEALPVGTYKLDIYGEPGLFTFYVTNVDNPFNKGRYSKYTNAEGDNSVYVLRGNRTVDEGVSDVYIQYPRPFSVSPGLVAINVLKDGELTNVLSNVSSVNAEGFTVTFGEPIPDDGVYSVDWAIWTRATPLLLLPLIESIGPYFVEDL